MGPSAIAKTLRIGRASVYRVLEREGRFGLRASFSPLTRAKCRERAGRTNFPELSLVVVPLWLEVRLSQTRDATSTPRTEALASEADIAWLIRRVSSGPEADLAIAFYSLIQDRD